MPCFKIEYAFVSNKSQRRSRSSLLRSSPAAGAAAPPAATNSTTPGWTPSWLCRQRLSILDWLVTFACLSPSGKLLQFVSYFMRLLLATHMQLRLPGCVCVCVWKFTSLRFSQKTTNELRPARQNLFAYLNYYWNETKPNQNNITKALPKKCYPFSCFLFFSWLAPDLHIKCNSKLLIYGCYSCTWIRIRVILLSSHTIGRKIMERCVEIPKVLHTLMRQWNL